MTEQPSVEGGQYYEELNRLFHIYRLSNLNARYYGCRAERFEKRSKWASILTAFFSTIALSLILGVDPKIEWVRNVAAALAGTAALISGVTPFMGWTEKGREMRNLHFAYSQLFGQIEFAITEIGAPARYLQNTLASREWPTKGSCGSRR